MKSSEVYRQIPINALTGQVGSATQVTGNPTNQDLAPDEVVSQVDFHHVANLEVVLPDFSSSGRAGQGLGALGFLGILSIYAWFVAAQHSGRFLRALAPILLGIAWFRFLNPEARSERPKWRHVLGAANLLAVSALLIICVVKFLVGNCNVDAGDWS